MTTPAGYIGTTPTELIGRSRDLERLAAVTAAPDAGLVTVTGPAGVGKSRLVMEFFRHRGEGPGGGVEVFDFAQVTDTSVAGLMLRQLREQCYEGSPAVRKALERVAAGKHTLLFDHYEDVADDLAPLLAEFRRCCPQVRIVCVGTARLGLYGERVVRIGPLATGDPAPASPAALAAVPAVELFVQCARSVRPEFALTAENAPDVLALCRQAGGLPLAIELAAAQITLAEPDLILERFENDPGDLHRPDHHPYSRHASIADMVAWVLARLRPEERTQLVHLAVFQGPFTMRAAVGVLDGLHGAAYRTMERLIDKSVLIPDEQHDGELRLSIPHALRRAAAGLLTRLPVHPALRRAHAEHFRTAATAAAAAGRPGPGPEARPDLLAAFEHWRQAGDGPAMAAIAQALYAQCVGVSAGGAGGASPAQTGQSSVGVGGGGVGGASPAEAGQASAGLGAGGGDGAFPAQAGQSSVGVGAGGVGGASPAQAGQASAGLGGGGGGGASPAQAGQSSVGLGGGGAGGAYAGEAARCLRLVEEALRVLPADEHRLLGRTLEAAGDLALRLGSPAARGHLTRAHAAHRAAHDEQGALRCLTLLGEEAYAAGEPDRARRCFEEAHTATLPSAVSADFAATRRHLVRRLAAVLRDAGDLPRARELALAGLAEELGDPGHGGGALLTRYVLATVRWREHDSAQARALFADAAEQLGTLPESAPERAECLELLAVTLNSWHRVTDWPALTAALALADQLRRRSGRARPKPLRDLVGPVLATAAQELTAEQYAAAVASGPAMTWQDALRLIPGEPPPPPPPARVPAPAAPPPPTPSAVATALTKRELEVALLVAEGMTNRIIARELGIAEWTVVNHLRKVMRKLGCQSRVQVTRRLSLT